MFLAGLSVQKRVVHALFLRELKTRFGKYRLGYLWALLEPVAHMALLMVIFGYIMSRAMPEISFIVFLINGLVPWFLFSNITSRSLTAIEANQGLLSYAPVHPVDTLISRTLLETMIYAMVYLVLMMALWLSGEAVSLINVPRLLSLWLALALFSMGLGLIFMVIGHAFNEAQKILPIVLKPLYFISGIMFPINIIPQQYHYLVDWNPLLHMFELLRQTVVPTYHVLPSLSLTYLWQSAMVVLAIGLILYKGREPAILRSS